MTRRGAVLLVGAVLSAGCTYEARVGPPAYAPGAAAGAAAGVAAGGAAGGARATGQYLYLPATNIPIEAVRSVVVQTADGQRFDLSAADVHAAAAGRLAVALPQGVTDGTVTVNLNDQTLNIPFHIVVSMVAAPVLGSVAVQQADPRCGAVAGNWGGNIWRSADATATAFLQVLDDCRTVQGVISASSPGSGSVDATIEGVWDPAAGTLVARDTQLFNVRPTNGGRFCPTTRYDLRLTPDGQLVGVNDTSGTDCGGHSPVRLNRTQ